MAPPASAVYPAQAVTDAEWPILNAAAATLPTA